jgi:hypothetical protein
MLYLLKLQSVTCSRKRPSIAGSTGSNDMLLTTSTQVFLAGLTGGALLELIHWYALRREPEFPAYARSVRYWIVSALMALAGGLLAFLYFGGRAEGIVALHVGLSAPLILQKLSTTVASQSGARSVGADMMTFFRW